MNNTHNIIWLAGLLEGEGYFTGGYASRPNQAGISVEMKDEDVIQRVASLFGVSYNRPRIRNPIHSQTFKTQIRGARALKIMSAIRPYMGNRRGLKIDSIMDGAAHGRKRS